MKNKVIILSLVAVLVLSLGAVGCSSKKTTTTTTTTPVTATKTTTTTTTTTSAAPTTSTTSATPTTTAAETTTEAPTSTEASGGTPPDISSHAVAAMAGTCTMCHVVGLNKTPADHADRTSDQCLTCHKAAAGNS